MSKKLVLGSCCVAALVAAAGCQTGTGARSHKPMGNGGVAQGAFTKKDATQQRGGGQPMGSSQSPLMGAQFPSPSSSGMQPVGGMQPMGGMGGLPMNSNMGQAPTLGNGTATGMMPASFNSAPPSTGAIPPFGTNPPFGSNSPSLGLPPGTSSRNTVSPAPGGGFDMPPPMATPTFNSNPSLR